MLQKFKENPFFCIILFVLMILSIFLVKYIILTKSLHDSLPVAAYISLFFALFHQLNYQDDKVKSINIANNLLYICFYAFSFGNFLIYLLLKCSLSKYSLTPASIVIASCVLTMVIVKIIGNIKKKYL